ncbi:phage tail sheath family protein, partial [Phenylobacterium sp.]|uniref:phage tail sheath family protein n=1 Tax=Phenylobacterium sp. TaxID=1871053 RepID=UPI002EDBA862
RVAVVEVASAVAAFVGYTAAGSPDTPVRVGSMAEFEAVFGGPPRPRLRVAAAPQGYVLTRSGPAFRLHDAMRLFFANGGGVCWIVSVGGYDAPAVEAAALARGLAALEGEAEPTLVVIPEAVELAAAECYALQVAMLAHCAAANRFAILDIHGGERPRGDPGGDVVAAFRDAIGTEHLSYGAAYYPWVRTSLFDGLTAADFEGDGVDVAELFAGGGGDALREAAAARLGLMPPASALAGIYATVDATRGVWKAPANVGLSGVMAPAVAIDAQDQEDLNTPLSGRSVNAIRAFPGEGVLVWGARTLDGASADWRYISVRRTCQMIEESVRPALAALVFEPNTAATWLAVRGLVETYLTGLWRRGGLVGVKPEQAFAVQCGLGQTMTQADVDGGVLRVVVMLALIRPAEFIVLTFEQRMTPPA